MHQVIITTHFKNELKPLVKKYPYLKNTVIEELESFNVKSGVHLGNSLYKVRLSPKGFPKGKSKAFRLIIYSLEQNGILVPITIYFKGDQENLSPKELNKHLEITLVKLHNIE